MGIAAALLLVLAVTAGGGTSMGLMPDFVVEVASLPVLALAAIRLPFSPIKDRLGLVLFCATLLLPLLQLIPLAPGVWTELPGRSAIVAIFNVAGLPLPSMPLSLDQNGTWSSFLALLPAAAIYLAALQANLSERILLLSVIGILGCISALVGVAQATGGMDVVPWLADQFYNKHAAIGFFVNRNHFGIFMALLIPLSAAIVLITIQTSGPRHPVIVAAWCFVFVAAVVGLAASFSRAGVSLGVAGCFGSLLLVWSGRSQILSQRRMLWIFIAVLVAVLVAQQMSLIELIKVRSAIDSRRVEIFQTTITAIRAFLPVGSGFGSFVPVYQQFEADSDLKYSYVNNAHNDWLQLVLEGGIPSAVLIALFLAWFVLHVVRCWHSPRDHRGLNLGNLLIPRVASVIVAMFLAHSAVDYPLRTTAMLTVFALSCGLLVPTDAPNKPASGRLSRVGAA